MKKAAFLIIIAGILACASCSKSNSSQSTSSDTWTFKNTTYHFGTGQFSQYEMYFTSTDGSSEIILNFNNGNVAPSASATYQVSTIAYPPPNQVTVTLSLNNNNTNDYLPSQSNPNTNHTVTITNENGKYRVQSSGIEMTNGQDSALLIFDVQPQ